MIVDKNYTIFCGSIEETNELISILKKLNLPVKYDEFNLTGVYDWEYNSSINAWDWVFFTNESNTQVKLTEIRTKFLNYERELKLKRILKNVKNTI